MRVLYFLFYFTLISGMAFSQTTSASLVKKVTGFSHPESVVYDEVNEIYYVSNIGEKEKGDGFISKVSAEGEILELNWIPGLNDPKGLLVLDTLLYVTDVTELVEMSIKDGKILNRYAVEGAGSLNDIAEGEDGEIYFSDLKNSSIYKKEKLGGISQWLNSNELNSPNGLLLGKEKIFVASWGEDQDGDFLKVDINTREIEKITTKGIGNLDGIQAVDENSFYVSDWATGKIYKIDVTGNTSEILVAEKSSGDIYFSQPKNLLVLPMNFQNALWWYQLQEN